MTSGTLAAVPLTVIGVPPESGAPVPQTGAIIITPPHQPNYVLNVVAPIIAILVRFLNTFLTNLAGLLTAAMTPVGGRLLYTSDFSHLLITCASLALPGAGLGFIKDCVTVFGKLETKFPLLTGSV